MTNEKIELRIFKFSTAKTITEALEFTKSNMMPNTFDEESVYYYLDNKCYDNNFKPFLHFNSDFSLPSKVTKRTKVKYFATCDFGENEFHYYFFNPTGLNNYRKLFPDRNPEMYNVNMYELA